MNLEIFKKVIIDFQNKELPELTKRDQEVLFIKNMSSSIIGARRAGKTYRTYQFIQSRLDENVKIENFCRIQFNDHRLINIKSENLHLIDDAYYSLFPEKLEKEQVYFIFDEIHRIEGWEDYILYLLENKNHFVLITGSTSKLLKGEISSSLRGKNFPVKLFPFSFKEFIRYFKIDEDIVSSKGQAYLRRAFVRYINQGAFPGLLDVKEANHIELLQTYWDTMILRDIIEAHPDDNIDIVNFNHLSQALISRISCPMTVRKIIKNLEEEGLKFSAETIYKYLKYLEEAFMLFTISIYSKSEKIRARNYNKVYAIDWALADSIAQADGIDISRKLENVVFIELLRRGYEVSYYQTKSGYEIDFIVNNKKNKQKHVNLYQVCYKLDDKEVKNREVRAIVDAAKYLKINKCFIITFNEEELIELENTKIHVVPAWKWLLE